MDPLTYEKLTQNPQLLSALLQQAHRERAEAVHRLIIAPIKELFSPLELEGCSRTASSKASASSSRAAEPA